ncbi:thiamine phosphate synthase, partial [Sulfurovum sp.]
MIAYAVTDPSTLDFNHLDSDLQRFSQKASMIVYRDKANADYDVKAIDFVEVAKRLDFEKVLVHGDRILAETVKADGVHLASTQLDTIPDAKARNLFVVVSTHSLKEVQEAEALGADMVTFSPIFSTPNKGKAVGLEALK